MYTLLFSAACRYRYTESRETLRKYTKWEHCSIQIETLMKLFAEFWKKFSRLNRKSLICFFRVWLFSFMTNEISSSLRPHFCDRRWADLTWHSFSGYISREMQLTLDIDANHLSKNQNWRVQGKMWAWKLKLYIFSWIQTYS